VKRKWPYPRIFAHRGGGSLAPENTLSAIRLGQTLGFKGHEFDVKLSKDGVAILLHDETVERTTTGAGRAADLTWSELLKLDAGGWHSPLFRGERVPSFEEVAQQLRSKGTHANVEIKPSAGRERETGEKVAQQARALWIGEEVAPLLSSFSFEAMMAAKQAAPELPRGWLVKQFGEADWERLAALEAASLHTDHTKFDLARLPELHDKGYRVMLYTVNDPEVAKRLLAAGVDGIFTDNLKEFATRFPAMV
jgi:glycerophosphoryl diester phosphodiesterase